MASSNDRPKQPERRRRGGPRGSKTKRGLSSRASLRQKQQRAEAPVIDDDSMGSQDSDHEMPPVPAAPRTSGIPVPRQTKSEVIQAMTSDWVSSVLTREGIPTDYEWLQQSGGVLSSKTAAIAALKQDLRGVPSNAELWTCYKDRWVLNDADGSELLTLWRLCQQAECIPSDLVGVEYKTRFDAPLDANWC